MEPGGGEDRTASQTGGRNHRRDLLVASGVLRSEVSVESVFQVN
jgi:hypothetical protein